VAADVFTIEVWTGRGLVTYDVAFLLDVQSRRIQMIGCTPYPNEAFVIQCLRQATHRPHRLLSEGRLLLCDRDPKWSSAVEKRLGTAGVHVARTPPSAPNCNAYAERFVRSVKEECLDRIVPPGERQLRTIIASETTRGLQRVDRTSNGPARDWRRSPAPARRRDPQLLLPISGVGRSIRAWDRTGNQQCARDVLVSALR
jgi:hypothetical protein